MDFILGFVMGFTASAIYENIYNIEKVTKRRELLKKMDNEHIVADIKYDNGSHFTIKEELDED